MRLITSLAQNSIQTLIFIVSKTYFQVLYVIIISIIWICI